MLVYIHWQSFLLFFLFLAETRLNDRFCLSVDQLSELKMAKYPPINQSGWYMAVLCYLKCHFLSRGKIIFKCCIHTFRWYPETFGILIFCLSSLTYSFVLAPGCSAVWHVCKITQQSSLLREKAIRMMENPHGWTFTREYSLRYIRRCTLLTILLACYLWQIYCA